ncbi:MAG: hypothetical protein Q6366_014585 [Candidatus Freyarchaeota archaeon]
MAKAELQGTWVKVSEKNISAPKTITLAEDSTYTWGEEKGRWATLPPHIWLLAEETSSGTKWKYTLDGSKLILTEPEDFKYLGKGKYIYFQLTNPKAEVKFMRRGK